jgi:hypothetical protein
MQYDDFGAEADARPPVVRPRDQEFTMKLSDRISVATPLAHRAARRAVRAVKRLRHGATFVAAPVALVALPGIARGAEAGSNAHVLVVVTAFGVLVAAATVSSVACSLYRRNARARVGEPD